MLVAGYRLLLDDMKRIEEGVDNGNLLDEQAVMASALRLAEFIKALARRVHLDMGGEQEAG